MRMLFFTAWIWFSVHYWAMYYDEMLKQMCFVPETLIVSCSCSCKLHEIDVFVIICTVILNLSGNFGQVYRPGILHNISVFEFSFDNNKF